MAWTVKLTRRSLKQTRRLPKATSAALQYQMSRFGPVRGNWPNYSKPGSQRHHCHLKKGNPTYVAVWEESSQGIKLIEVVYVGTHEKAPY